MCVLVCLLCLSENERTGRWAFKVNAVIRKYFRLVNLSHEK